MRSVVVGTAGHIDHGKSALVWALTGSDPDRLKEEKARGITIDLGFAHWQSADITFAFVDVPGHERFVKNMLAGVGGIDLVVLVIAADESVMPQTREHFEICRLLRVPAGLVALTKVDLVDPDTLDLVRLEARDLAVGSFLEGAPVIPVSSKTGVGVDALRAALLALGERVPGRLSDGPARLPVDRVFSMRGFGTVVTGTLVSGRIDVDQDLVLQPSGRRVKVRGLQVHGQRQVQALAGQRVAANLGGVDLEEVVRGDTLGPGGALTVTRRLDAVIELVSGGRPVRHGTRVRFHHGTSEILGRVVVAGARSHDRSLSQAAESESAGAPPSEIPPGSAGYVRLRLESPAVVTRGDRFILRAYSPAVTIGGGEVLDPQPPRFGARSEAGRTRFSALDPAGHPGRPEMADASAVMVMASEAGPRGLPVSALTARVGLHPAAAKGVLTRLEMSGQIIRVGEYTVATEVLARLRADLIAAVGEHHRRDPLSPGLPREEARARLAAHIPVEIFERAIADLVVAHALAGRERLALPGHELALSPEEERARSEIERRHRESGLRPPDLAALAEELSVPASLVDRIVKLLVRQRVLVRLDTLLFHQDALAGLKQNLATMKAAAGGVEVRIDVATFKDRYGVTRKFAIPLLEFLDRERVTRRVGDARIVL